MKRYFPPACSSYGLETTIEIGMFIKCPSD
jgi:hypothetical protein